VEQPLPGPLRVTVFGLVFFLAGALAPGSRQASEM